MKFNEKLRAVMQQLNLTQAQVVGMTGCSKAAISYYLSGKNTPSDKKQSDIAVSLGFPADYFENDISVTEPKPQTTKKANDGTIQELLVSDAAKFLHMNHNTVRKGLQQGVFPWGYAIRTSEKRWVYFINAKRFAEIEQVSLEGVNL